MSDIVDAAPGTWVELVISEPWELASPTTQNAAVSGTVVDREHGGDGTGWCAIAVRLEAPLEWGGRTHRFVVFLPRETIESLEGRVSIDGVYVGVHAEGPDGLVGSGLIRRYEDWRGGLGGRARLNFEPVG